MNNPKWTLTVVSALALVGCNVGNAPEPMTTAELKDAVNKATPEQQVKWIQSSPMPAAEKAQKIKDIEDRTGYKAPASNAPKYGG